VVHDIHKKFCNSISFSSIHANKPLFILCHLVFTYLINNATGCKIYMVPESINHTGTYMRFTLPFVTVRSTYLSESGSDICQITGQQVYCAISGKTQDLADIQPNPYILIQYKNLLRYSPLFYVTIDVSIFLCKWGWQASRYVHHIIDDGESVLILQILLYFVRNFRTVQGIAIRLIWLNKNLATLSAIGWSPLVMKL